MLGFMLNRNRARLVCLAVCLLMSAVLLPVYAFDDGINTAAPYMAFDPNTGSFHQINPCKSSHPPPACTGGAEAGAGGAIPAGDPATQTTGAQPATDQSAPAAAQPATGQSAPAADRSTAALVNSQLIMIVGVVVGLALLGAVFWSLRRKRTVTHTA